MKEDMNGAPHPRPDVPLRPCAPAKPQNLYRSPTTPIG
jgi:hypothetical protein